MKNILIVGAGSGIGLHTAQMLQHTHKLYTITRTDNEEYKKLNAVKYVMDVTTGNWDAMDELPETLDGLVYTPGSINLKPFTRLSAADFLKDIEVNLLGAVHTIQRFLPLLKKTKGSGIVLFSSVAATTGFPFHTSIAAAKGAVEGFTKALAADLAPSVRVNCIAPGLTHTPLAAQLLSTPEKIEASAQRYPLKRIGSAADMAHAAVFLLSESSAWMTGQVLHIDGGVSSVKI